MDSPNGAANRPGSDGYKDNKKPSEAPVQANMYFVSNDVADFADNKAS